MRICVGKQSDDSRTIWTDGTGIAACGRTDEHKAHTFAQAFPLDWPGIETWRQPERIEHMLKGRTCPMCGDRTVGRVCRDGCKRDWNDAETMRRFTTADDRYAR